MNRMKGGRFKEGNSAGKKTLLEGVQEKENLGELAILLIRQEKRKKKTNRHRRNEGNREGKGKAEKRLCARAASATSKKKKSSVASKRDPERKRGSLLRRLLRLRRNRPSRAKGKKEKRANTAKKSLGPTMRKFVMISPRRTNLPGARYLIEDIIKRIRF